jgi:glycosyltransferase involved in cell wall biosynthesis
VATRLTVLLPVFNGMPFLPGAVESILSQTFTDFTLIIIDDGSTDGSGDYLSTLRDTRIVLISQTNQGIGASLNRGLKMCRSEYVARMDADDISMADRFASQVEYLDAHPDVVILGTQIEFLVGTVSQRALHAPLDHEEIEARLMKGRAGLCHPSLMFRTAAAIACGGYPAGRFGEDFDFFLRMCEQGRTANLDRVLFQYRLQAAQISMARSNELIRINHFAAWRATCRYKGLQEPSFDDFLQNASLISRWRWTMEAWELIQYRTARIEIASGRPISGALRMSLLGMCHPVSAFCHLWRMIRTLDKGCIK